MNQVKVLEQSIIKTLNYFDLLSFPLTPEELFRYLWMPPRMGYEEFLVSLRGAERRSNPLVSGIVSESRGIATSAVGGLAMTYYHLPGRESLIEIRQNGMRETGQKLIKARRAVKFIRSVPFLKAIFVCNSVGAGMARPESDIDFFIVAEKNRIWIVRFFTNLILRIFRLRTYGAHQADRICLSFYVDTAHLDLAPWRVADDDIHFAYWIHMMTPLYDPENYYEKFLKANGWVEKHTPNLSFRVSPPRADDEESSSLMANQISHPRRRGIRNDNHKIPIGNIGRIWKKMWEAMWQGSYGNVIENEAKKFQMTKMAFSLKEKSKLGDNGVVIQDGIIKLHANDARKIVRDKWLEKIKVL